MNSDGRTLLDDLIRLKDSFIIIQQNLEDGLFTIIGKGTYIKFSFRALPNAFSYWKSPSSNSEKLEVTVVDEDSTVIYVKEKKKQQLPCHKQLNDIDVDILKSLNDEFKSRYNNGVQHFDSGVYYHTQPIKIIDSALEKYIKLINS